MKIDFTNKLNYKKIRNIENFINKINKLDHTFIEPYLDNSFNFDEYMPSFFMAYNNSNDLIGILAVYADSKDVEIQLKIDPAYRRKKVATYLYQSFLKETKEYDLNSVSFLTEEIFLEKNPSLIKNLNLKRDESEEFLLSRKHNKKNIKKSIDNSNLIFEKASIKDIDELTSLTHEAFNAPLDIAKKYNIFNIESNTSDIYVLRNDKDIISRVSVDYSSNTNYMYSVATKKEYLRQGHAYNLLFKTIKALEKENNKDFQISVDTINTKAIKLYEKLGFITDTKVIYLDAIDMDNVFYYS